MMAFIKRYAMLIVGGCIAVLGFLIVLAIVDPDNRVTRDTASVAPWASGLAAIVLATLTALYVSATEDMARATEALAEETKRAREMATRPSVIADLEADQSHLFWLTIRNTGNAVAHEFRVHVYPDFEMVSGKGLNSLPLFSTGLPALGPGAQIRTMLDFGGRLFEAADKNGKPLQYTIRLSYKDDLGNKLGPFEYPIDFNAFRGLIPGEDVLKTISNHLRDIASKMS